MTLDLFTQKDDIQLQFERFIRDNPEVVQLVVQFADEAKSAGRTRFSMDMIFHRIRWYTNVETRGEKLKINDHYTSRMVRYIEERYPRFRGFFAKRQLTAERGMLETTVLKGVMP